MLPPDRIEINITELCNKTCSFCPRSSGYPNLNVHMTMETLHAFLDQVKDFDHEPVLAITGRGEPFLNKKLPDIIRASIPHFRYIDITTNGDHLHKMELVDHPKAHYVVNSYDSHEQYHERKKKYPHLHHNNKVDGPTGGGVNRGGWFDVKMVDDRCYTLTRRLYIDWNGDVNLCCNDWKYKHTFGNVHTDRLVDVWYEGLNRVRKSLLTGDRSCTKACSECDAGPSHRDLEYFLNNV